MDEQIEGLPFPWYARALEYSLARNIEGEYRGFRRDMGYVFLVFFREFLEKMVGQ